MSQTISEPSAARDNPLLPNAARVRKLAASVLPGLLAGCELVIGGIPDKPSGDEWGATDAAVDARSAEAGVPATDAARDASSESALDAGDAPDARPAHIAEAGADVDAMVVPDAAPQRDAMGGGDASSPDADVPCGEPVWWYVDRDADGYGVAAERSFVCLKPAGSWAPLPGDCNDADARVHPGQQSYFGTPARSADGSDSFDFDCSGSEDGTGLQTAAPDSCGLLSLTACIGSGYAKTAREGFSVNRLCGSDIQLTCQAAGLLGCTTATERVSDPYRCR